MWKLIRRVILTLILAVILFFIILNIFSRPSNDRDWSLDQAILPSAEIQGNMVHISNIRNFTYASTTSYTPAYYDKTFDLTKLKKVYYIVEPFSGPLGAAHTFVSFEFEDDEFVAISVEIRKEKGESFSPLKGLLNRYELMYVIADERDVIKLRTNFRKDDVFLYLATAMPEKARALFIAMITRANELKDTPEFYNTLTNTCTTNIVSHINDITPDKVPFSFKVLMPEYSDELALDIGLIDTDLSLEQARAKFKINEKALRYAEDPHFSRLIRQ
jgi:hypothetical protein